MEVEFGLEDLAKYPFLDAAGEQVKQLSLDIADLGHPDYQRVVERARQRILQAIESRRVSEEPGQPEVEILSFLLALILVRATKLEHLLSRYALAEAVRVEDILQVEGGRRKGIVIRVFKEVLGVDVDMVEDGLGSLKVDFRIPVAEYLKRAAGFHELEWKLVNRAVNEGFVYLGTKDLIRLIRDEIRRVIYQRAVRMHVPALPEQLQKVLDEVIQLAPPPRSVTSRVEVTPDKYPPCVVHTLGSIQSGGGGSHYGRFLITTYLLAIGKSVDQVVGVYPKVPDFDERVTTYQVEHIAGLRGGRVKYRVPSCRTLLSHSLCFKDEVLCYNIHSPLQFPSKYSSEGKVKKVWRKEQQQD